MHVERTEHVYEVWASTAVGPMSVAWYPDEARAVARYRQVVASQDAAGFGATAWITRDGEDFEPGA